MYLPVALCIIKSRHNVPTSHTSYLQLPNQKHSQKLAPNTIELLKKFSIDLTPFYNYIPSHIFIEVHTNVPIIENMVPSINHLS